MCGDFNAIKILTLEKKSTLKNMYVLFYVVDKCIKSYTYTFSGNVKGFAASRRALLQNSFSANLGIARLPNNVL